MKLIICVGSYLITRYSSSVLQSLLIILRISIVSVAKIKKKRKTNPINHHQSEIYIIKKLTQEKRHTHRMCIQSVKQLSCLCSLFDTLKTKLRHTCLSIKLHFYGIGSCCYRVSRKCDFILLVSFGETLDVISKRKHRLNITEKFKTLTAPSTKNSIQNGYKKVQIRYICRHTKNLCNTPSSKRNVEI